MGFIKTFRQIKRHPRYQDPIWFKVWMHLLLSVCHKEYKDRFDGKEITLQQGQLVTGRKRLSIETGVTEDQVRRALKNLIEDNQITVVSCHLSSLITITNWHKYQVIHEPSVNEVELPSDRGKISPSSPPSVPQDKVDAVQRYASGIGWGNPQASTQDHPKTSPSDPQVIPTLQEDENVKNGENDKKSQEDKIPYGDPSIDVSPKKNTKKKLTIDKPYSDGFLRFKEIYPNMAGTGKAWDIWQSKGCEFIADVIIEAVKSQIEIKEWNRSQDAFDPEWKHATTWLNQGCWADKLVKAPPKRIKRYADDGFLHGEDWDK